MKNSDIVIAYVTFCASVAVWRCCRRLKSTEKLTGTSCRSRLQFCSAAGLHTLCAMHVDASTACSSVAPCVFWVASCCCMARRSRVLLCKGHSRCVNATLQPHQLVLLGAPVYSHPHKAACLCSLSCSRVARACRAFPGPLSRSDGWRVCHGAGKSYKLGLPP